MEELKQQLQEDILSILDGFNVEESMNAQDYEKMKNCLCDAVIKNIDKIQ